MYVCKMIFFAFLFLNFLLCDSDIINTHYGALSGLLGVSRGGVKYYRFCGIPYARPPVGDLRFQVITDFVELLSIIKVYSNFEYQKFFQISGYYSFLMGNLLTG